MAAMMQKRAALANRSMSAVSPSTRNLVVARYSQSLTASDLAAFKIVDLVDIAKKRGVSGGRDATRDSLTNAILRKGVSVNDLTKGQLAELKAKNPSAGASSGSSSYSAPAGGRFSSYSNGASSSASRAAPAASSGATLSAGDLSAFKIVDLVEIAGKKGVSAGRNATRDTLTNGLVRAGVTLNDLTRGQLVDLGIKLGKAGLSRDINQARAELAALIGGSGSAPASWRSTPAPAASSDRFSNYSRSSTPAAASAGGASGARLSASDLAVLRIDDLRDLVKKTGAELPREPTKDGVISALVAKGVSLDHCTRGMLVDLSTKLGAPLARDVNGLKANLAGRIGGGSSSSWRSTPAPSSASSAAPAAGGDRWAKYSAGSTQAASWRRSGSHNASGSKLSASDLTVLRIDDLRDLVKKTGAELPREPTKEGVISALIKKNVSLNDLTRGMLVDLANKLGTPLARDVDNLRKNLASAVGKGSYSPAAPATSTSSWRSAPSTPAPASEDRWASYSRSSSNGRGASSAGGAVYEADLQNFKIDMLSEMARKKGISMRNATKDSLVNQLVKSITLADLSRGQLIEILSNIGQSTNGSVEDLRSRVAAASSQRQSARSRSLAGARW